MVERWTDWLFLCCNDASWQWIVHHWKASLLPFLNGATFIRNIHLWDEQQSLGCGLLPWNICQMSMPNPVFLLCFFAVDFCFKLPPHADNQASDCPECVQEHYVQGRIQILPIAHGCSCGEDVSASYIYNLKKFGTLCKMLSKSQCSGV